MDYFNENIRILDKNFSPFIPESEIQAAVKTIAGRMNRDLAGKNPLFLSVLNGAFMFTSDLLKNIAIPCEVEFIRLASYQGVQSTGKVSELLGLMHDIADRTVVVVEDIIDSGLTMKELLQKLQKHHPAEIRVSAMFLKPQSLEVENLPLDYIGMEIGNDFIVGYGLDYEGYGRNLKAIYKVR